MNRYFVKGYGAAHKRSLQMLRAVLVGLYIVGLSVGTCIATPVYSASPAQLYADTLLLNGKVVTVDKSFSIAQAVAIKDGKFIAVGANKDIKAYAGPKTKKVDLKGKMVLPGFIDSHPHLLTMASKNITLDVARIKSIEDIKKRIAEAVKAKKPGEWVLCSAVGEPPDYMAGTTYFDEKRWPTRGDIDEVAPNNPVLIQGIVSIWSPHPAIMNSAGLKLLGITRETPDEPKGLIIIKNPQTGEPNGQLERAHFWNYGRLFWRLLGMLPRPTFEQSLNGVKAGMQRWNAVGVTAGYEGHVTDLPDIRILKELDNRKDLTMRMLFAYEVPKALDKAPIEEVEKWIREKASYSAGRGIGNDWLRVGGITASLDGPVQLGVAVMRAPYIGPFGEETEGVQMFSTERLKEICLLAAKHDVRMNIQFAGSKTTDIGLEAVEYANSKFPVKGKRWILQHVQHPTPEQVKRYAELGLYSTTVVGFEYTKGKETFVRRMNTTSTEIIDTLMPFRWFFDAGAVIGNSTDGAHYEPMWNIWDLLTRMDGRTGEIVMTPVKKITREEAIRLSTIENAKVLWWEDRIGSIETGKLADLAVIDTDILKCPVNDIKKAKVLTTVVGGNVVYGEF
jgi:predicted amidohydrolase YtcJ